MRAVLLVALLAAGCGSSPSTPTSPTPQPTPTTTRETWTLTGTVVSTQRAEAIAGARIAPFDAVTDASGTFTASGDQPRATRITIEASGYLTRSTSLLYSEQPRFDLINLTGFSMDFYRAFVRNGFEAPGALQPLRRWTQAPRLYIRRVDEAGIPIDSSLLALVERAARETSQDWGERLQIASIESGPETREGQPGWITLKWLTTDVQDRCGATQVAVSGGYISINPYWSRCACLYPNGYIVRHELGHSFGFYHTGDDQDLMGGLQTYCTQRASRPSARERAHAAIAYTRPVGNTDPDNDPVGQAFLETDTHPVIVVD